MHLIDPPRLFSRCQNLGRWVLHRHDNYRAEVGMIPLLSHG